MRAVIDTNVLVSGLPWHGVPRRLIERVQDGTLDLISSPALLAELAAVLGRPKFQAPLRAGQLAPDRLVSRVRRLAEVIDPPKLPEAISRDADDDAVLALAMAAQADLIVSCHADLLVLRQCGAISIVGPAEALARQDQ